VGSSFWLERHARALPCLEPADQRIHILETVLFESFRHPGARRFIWSSTVGHDRPVARNVGKVLLDLIGRNPNRTGQFGFRFSPRLRVPCIDKEDIFTAIKPFFGLAYVNSFSHFLDSKTFSERMLGTD
jgi:hypothetical protein